MENTDEGAPCYFVVSTAGTMTAINCFTNLLHEGFIGLPKKVSLKARKKDEDISR